MDGLICLFGEWYRKESLCYITWCSANLFDNTYDKRRI